MESKKVIITDNVSLNNIKIYKNEYKTIIFIIKPVEPLNFCERLNYYSSNGYEIILNSNNTVIKEMIDMCNVKYVEKDASMTNKTIIMYFSASGKPKKIKNLTDIHDLKIINKLKVFEIMLLIKVI